MASLEVNKKIKSKYGFVKPWTRVRAIHFSVSFKSKIFFSSQAWFLTVAYRVINVTLTAQDLFTHLVFVISSQGSSGLEI